MFGINQHSWSWQLNFNIVDSLIFKISWTLMNFMNSFASDTVQNSKEKEENSTNKIKFSNHLSYFTHVLSFKRMPEVVTKPFGTPIFPSISNWLQDGVQQPQINEVSELYDVHIIWVSEHNDIPGNYRTVQSILDYGNSSGNLQAHNWQCGSHIFGIRNPSVSILT